ncbi:retrotransposon-derived protein PEG10 [Pimephales promelas]|nr:retrotransposon-derived protein PEG10 [Pimephales promelas]
MEVGPAEDSTPTSNVDRILAALSGQASTIHRHEQILSEILQRLSVQTAFQASPVLTTPSVPAGRPTPPLTGLLPEPRLPAPESFPTENSKVAYIITLLTGKALDWATALWEQKSPLTGSCDLFVEEMKKVFHHPTSGGEVDHRLLQISQGTRSVAEFAIEFRTLASESGWDQRALKATFHRALSSELAFRDPAPDLESLIDSSIRVDNRIRERRRERRGEVRLPEPRVSSNAIESPPLPMNFKEPMQLGRARLSQAERERRMRDKCCLYCGKPEHFRSHCPELTGKDNSRP